MENKRNIFLSKGYVCRKIRLYNFLLERGFKPIQVRPDKDYAKRLVWIFNDTTALRNAVEDYYAIRDREVLGGE